MDDGREMLVRYCRANAPHRFDAALLLSETDEFFRRGAAGTYTLVPGSGIDARHVRVAVERIAGSRACAVRFYPRTELFAPRDRDLGGISRLSPTAIERDGGLLLKVPLLRQFILPLEKAMGHEKYHDLSETFMRTLGEPLWHSFENAYWEEVGYNLMLAVRALVLVAVHAYIGHSVWGDARKADALRPLLACLPRCIPYGLSAADGRCVLAISA